MRESDRRMTRDRMLDVVRSVRWRWRARLALRGLVWMAGLTGAVLLLSALGLERLRFSADAVVWLRIVTWGTLAVSFLLFFVRPLFQKVSDARVALYLEEHEPSLEHSVTAVLDEGSGTASPELTHRTTEIALERARDVDFGRRVERGGLYRFAGALTVLVVLAISSALLGPGHLKHGLRALLLPTVDAAEVNPYAVGVEPGDITIARGSDQIVTASLSGFEAGEASIFTREESERAFQRLSMLPGVEGGFEVMLLGVAEPTEYFVEATGVRSPTFTIDVADLPYVDRLDLTYYFPSYTGLPARTVEEGGDVAALPGTVVELRIQPTMVAPGGRLLLDGEPVEELTAQPDGTFSARFTVGGNSFYSLELARQDNGEMVPASPEYRIDVLDDLMPSISFSEPGRDISASAIEEVYLEMVADDDYGIGDIRLVYSVNAGAEDTVTVFQGRGEPLPQVSAGHTLYLEEWELEVGDLVSYYAVARDNRGGADREVVSDIYFLNVRPFERAYRQAEQQGGGGGGGGMGQQDQPMSDIQRQVIAATFNLIRQEDSYTPDELSENINSVGLAQGRLQDQVATLLQRMQNRGLVESDPGFRSVSEILPRAGEAMERAREELEDEELREALPDEQEALRFLQQAEETYERYIQMQRQQAGGGGGGQQAAEDLADLFELELDKLQNQYETVQRGQQQQADNEVDELLEELQELARRQEQMAERQRRAAAQGQSSGQSGDAQRDLASETEEAARQLQRLAREMNDRELEQTARDLQQAAESMRRSATSSGSQAGAQANSAQRRLEDARRQLEQARADRTRRNIDQAISTVDDLQRQQRDVQDDVRELPPNGDPRRMEEIERLRQRKDNMHTRVQEMERRLVDAANGAQTDNPEAAEGMRRAVEQIRESKLKEKLRYSRGTIAQWDTDSAITLELDIEGDLQEVRDELERARGSAGQSEPDPLEEALDDARDLVRGVEAMDRRLNEPGASGQQSGESTEGQEGQSGQEGRQQGQSGQEAQGQDGQQGQSGQQGQGREGQEGQPGQQGQAGEQGQGQQGQGNQRGPGGDTDRLGAGGGADGRALDRSAGPSYGGATRGDGRRFTPEEIRQYRSEFGQRERQARELRQELLEAGQSVEDLDAVIDAFERLQDEGVYADREALADVHREMLDRLKRLEFSLRREVEGEAELRGSLTGTDEVPEGYRELVEEYYRALARSGGRPPGGGA